MLFSKSRDPHGMHRLLRERLGRAIGDCQALLRHVAVINSSGCSASHSALWHACKVKPFGKVDLMHTHCLSESCGEVQIKKSFQQVPCQKRGCSPR